MILSLSDAAEFKKEVAEKFSINIHFCDSCGGQSFAAENPTEEFKQFVVDFFAAKQLQVVFSQSGERFTVKRA